MDQEVREKVQIIVATHKKYRMPADVCYLPVHVGAEGKFDSNGTPLDLGYQKDNTGINISSKNASYCELTGLYWAWKNLESEYIGLVHYRRHFCYRRKGIDPFDNILSDEEVMMLISRYKVIVPKKRRYIIETLYSHYSHTHYGSQLDETRNIIAEKFPDYIGDFDKVISQTWGYMFNMMIMEKSLIDEYCSWLFLILFELEKRVKSGMVQDSINLNAFQGRFYGRISEIIFNVWLKHQIRIGAISKKDIKEVHLCSIEKTNWYVKGTAFLKAKFLGEKYGSSF